MDSILESNKLIAKFMGVKQTERGEYIFDDLACSEHSLRYNEGWNWLMPVVERIEDIEQMGCQAYVYIAPFNIEVYCSGNLERGLSLLNYQLRGRKFAGKDKLDAVYDCVIQFINWYNNKGIALNVKA